MNDIITRAYKTLLQVVAAQALVYGTGSVDAPPAKTTVAVSVGATVLSVGWNLAVAWFTKTKNSRLDRLAEAIDKLVDARLAEQGVADPAPVAPEAPPLAPVESLAPGPAVAPGS